MSTLPFLPLLLLCARIQGDTAQHQALHTLLPTISDWPTCIKQAEKHGLGPLLYKHLREAMVPLPPAVKQQLQGLYLQHRRANQVRLATLSEILAAYRAAGLSVVLLKGGALAQTVYPEAGLRPMGDIDLLVKKPEAQRAQQVLIDLGFYAHVPQHEADFPDKHLLAATKEVAGVGVNIEVHHNLFDEDYRASLAFEDIQRPLQTVMVGEQAGAMLSYEEMLWHLCHHLAYHTQVWKPTRLVWVADIVGFANHFGTKIDWSYLSQTYPFVVNMLSVLHFINPLDPHLIENPFIKIGDAPVGLGEEFVGWPRTAIAVQRKAGKTYPQILRDSFLPPAWWLHLRYGIGSATNVFWARWVRHPWHILGWLVDWALTKGSRG